MYFKPPCTKKRGLTWKTVLVAVLFLMLPAIAPAAVKVYVSGVATTAGSSSGEVIIGDGGATMDAIGNLSGSANLEPGKTYQLTLNASGVANVTLNLRPVGAYTVYISGSQKKQIQAFSDGASPDIREVYDVEIRALSGDDTPGADTGVGIAGEIAWGVGLGRLYNGTLAGYLVMRSKQWDESLFDRGVLSYSGVNQQVSAIMDDQGKLCQVIAPEVFVDIVDADDGNGFTLHFYPPMALGAKQPSGRYLINANSEPFVSYAIRAGVNEGDPKFIVEKSTGSYTMTTTASQSAGSWMKTLNDQLSTEVRTEENITTDEGQKERIETIVVKNGNGKEATKTQRTYCVFPWNSTDGQADELIEEVQDPDGKKYTTKYDYWTDDTLTGSYGRIKSITYPDGDWVAYAYSNSGDNFGMLIREYHPWLGLPATPQTDSQAGRVIIHTYSKDWDGQLTLHTGYYEAISTTAAGKHEWGTVEVNKTLNGLKYWIYDQRSNYGGVDLDLRTITKTYQPNQDDENSIFNGLPVSVTNPDGTKVSYVYHRGYYGYNPQSPNTFTVNPTGTMLRQIVINGVAANVTGGVSLSTYEGTPIDPIVVVPGKSTMTTRITKNGRIMAETLSICINDGTFEPVNTVYYTYNAFGRLLNSVQNNGATYTATWADDFKTSETSATGVTYLYSSDTLQRVATAVKTSAAAYANGSVIYAAQGAITNEYAYDAAGRIISTRRTDGANAIMQESTTYDLSGHVVAQTNIDGYTSTTEYLEGGRKVIVHPACGGDVITEYYPGGQVKTVTGSAVVARTISYDAVSINLTTKIQYGASGTQGAWSSTTQDMLGRTVKTSALGPNGNTLETNYTYNNIGQLQKVTEPGVAPKLYVYDAMGALVQSGLDIDNNGTLDATSTDRFTTQSTQFVKDLDGAWWQETVTSAPLRATNAAMTTLSRTRTRLTKFPTGVWAESRVTDENGNMTTTTTEVDPNNRLVYQITQTPTSTRSVERVLFNGQLVEEIGTTGEHMLYSYDSLGRLSVTTPQKTKPIQTLYANRNGFETTQVWQTQYNDATLLARYGYDEGGRVNSITDALGGITHNRYNCRKELIQQWGTSTQPVSYTYDTLGRLTSQTTYRTNTEWNADTWPDDAAGDTTNFSYYGNTSYILERTSPGENGKKLAWVYDDMGRISTALNARQQSITYAYDSKTGELLKTTQPQSGDSQNQTVSTTYTYTRAGLTETVTDTALGTYAYTYGGTSGVSLTGVTLPAYYNGAQNTARQLTYGYENNGTPGKPGTGIAGRLKNVALGTTAQPASELAYGYTYTDIGTLSTITAVPAGQSARTFVYDYDTAGNAPWLMTGLHLDGSTETLRRKINYEAKYGTVESIDTTWSGISQARYDYTHDTRGMRKTAKQTGALYADYGDATYYQYGYNAKGELTEAKQYLGNDANATSKPLPGRQYGYSYDAMGNRVSTTRTAESELDEKYAANALNQITQKENHTAQLSGTLKEGARVLVRKGQGLTSKDTPPQGRFWNIEMLLGNAGTPAKAELTLLYGKAGAGSGGKDAYATDKRTAFQRQDAENMNYDADGNLTQDGLWNYTYDAKNQLIAMETRAELLSLLATVAGEPQPRKVEYTYDYNGRRVGKKVYKWNATAWIAESHTKYAYDGWNLIAEYAADPASGALSSSAPAITYVWGLDATGSLTATAGVGALLMIQNGSETYYPAYDGNGNVTGLLDKTGQPAAKYEYNPYGELNRLEGSYASKNPFRWSTKYTDTETGLVYYGLRYYAPRTGRFINQDPIKEKGGINIYAFVGNNPVNRVDVMGLYNDNYTPPNSVDPRSNGSFDIWQNGNHYSVDPNGDISKAVSTGTNSAKWILIGNLNNGSGISYLPPIIWNYYLNATLGQPTTTTGNTNANGAGLRPVTDQPKNPCGQSNASAGPISTAQNNQQATTASSGSDTPERITYTGKISYKAGALILGYGQFTGLVTSNATPAQAYIIAGRVDGVGIQIGYIKGITDVTFKATSPEGMLGSNGGFWTASVGLGAGPLRAISGDLTVNAHNTGENRSEFGVITPGINPPGIDTDVSALDPKNFKPGVGFSGAFWGITVQTVTPICLPAPQK